MADDGSKEGSTWPMPKFMFLVDLGDDHRGISFQEVSGLETETKIIEYRHGDNPNFSTIKMPGVAKVGNVTMKKGILSNDDLFWEWYNQIKMNTIKRQTVTIKLLDEKGDPMMVWTLTNAWPTKVSSTDLKSDSNEVAIDSIEIAHEGLTIENLS